jgi:hypothetical protein
MDALSAAVADDSVGVDPVGTNGQRARKSTRSGFGSLYLITELPTYGFWAADTEHEAVASGLGDPARVVRHTDAPSGVGSDPMAAGMDFMLPHRDRF